MKNPRLLIVQTGTTTLHGDYPAWFEKALGFAMPVVRAHQGEKLDPQRHRPEGIIVTGSPLSVTERAPWMLRLGDDLLRIGARGVPVLGVCFGHQLLARAAGGDVVLNPRGREIGTVRVQLTPAGRRDPLFAWVGGDTDVPQPEGGGTKILPFEARPPKKRPGLAASGLGRRVGRRRHVLDGRRVRSHDLLSD